MESETNDFSSTFREFLNPGSNDEDASKASNENGKFETARMESCVGEGCNEKQFVVGSIGTGSVGLFTYCADCYPNASKTDIGGESDDVVIVPSVDLSRTDTDENEKQETNSLLQNDYDSEANDGPPYRNPKLLFDHLSAVNSIDDYSSEFSIKTTSEPATKNLTFKLLPKNSLMAHTILYVCTCILRPLLYWYVSFVFK
jgi:hypothetical protein